MADAKCSPGNFHSGGGIVCPDANVSSLVKRQTVSGAVRNLQGRCIAAALIHLPRCIGCLQAHQFPARVGVDAERAVKVAGTDAESSQHRQIPVDCVAGLADISFREGLENGAQAFKGARARFFCNKGQRGEMMFNAVRRLKNIVFPADDGVRPRRNQPIVAAAVVNVAGIKGDGKSVFQFKFFCTLNAVPAADDDRRFQGCGASFIAPVFFERYFAFADQGHIHADQIPRRSCPAAYFIADFDEIDVAEGILDFQVGIVERDDFRRCVDLFNRGDNRSVVTGPFEFKRRRLSVVIEIPRVDFNTIKLIFGAVKISGIDFHLAGAQWKLPIVGRFGSGKLRPHAVITFTNFFQ